MGIQRDAELLVSVMEILVEEWGSDRREKPQRKFLSLLILKSISGYFEKEV